MAAPCTYTREMADKVCELIADGWSMLAISKMEGMPRREKVREWAARDYDGFAARYVEAKKERIHQMVEDTLDIADGDDPDPSNKKVRIEARRWIAARMNRATYGDHVAVDVKTTTASGASDSDLLAIALGSRSTAAASPEGED